MMLYLYYFTTSVNQLCCRIRKPEVFFPSARVNQSDLSLIIAIHHKTSLDGDFVPAS